MARARFIERMQGPRKGIYRPVTVDRNRSAMSLDDFVGRVGYHEGPYGFWYVKVPSEWVRRLGAETRNRRTGMKQVGFEGNVADPCSCQLERSGGVRVYPRVAESVWRPWLQREVIRRGWGMDEAKVFNDKLTHALRQVEIVGPSLPQSVAEKLPALIAVPRLGLTFKVDDTPQPRTLELGVNVQGLERFLQVDQIRRTVEDFRNEFWVALDGLKQQIESHLALIQEYRSEALTLNIILERMEQFLSRLEAKQGQSSDG